MAPPPTVDTFRPRPSVWWLYVLAALILGYVIGRVHQKTLLAKQAGPVGTCYTSDSTVSQRNVTQPTCQSTCSTCTWVQN